MDAIQYEEVPIQIQFEYLNNNEETELSKPYTVYILPNEELELNRMRIINTCDFRTKEERIYYYMFDKNKERFLINNIEIIYYYKQNNVVIMKNCKIFATQICEKLREEALNHKKNEEMTNEIRKSVMTDSKKNEIKIILRFLDTNLKVDMFTEDFIANNGLQYLDTIIQYNTGNIRTYALIAVNNLLDFQNAFNYFEKKKEFLSKLY